MASRRARSISRRSRSGPRARIRRRLFRTPSGGSQFRELVLFNDNSDDDLHRPRQRQPRSAARRSRRKGSPASRASRASPRSRQPGVPVTGLPDPTPAGATSLELDGLTGIPAAGWILIEEQVIRYTGTSTAAGRFFLTGIPASGPGAITADVPAGGRRVDGARDRRCQPRATRDHRRRCELDRPGRRRRRPGRARGASKAATGSSSTTSRIGA